MTAVFTILFAFVTGYLVRQRSLAVVGYLAAYAILFAYQTLGVLLDWMADDPPTAFGPAPTGFPVEYSRSETWGYGVVNLVIVVVGVGLVLLGAWARARRAARRTAVSVA